MRCSARLLAPVLLVLPLAAGAAGIYRWVDAQGQVHYSETVPQGVAATAQPKAPGPGHIAPRATAVASAKTVASPAAAAPAADAAKAKEERERKAKNCAAAKERVAFLEANPAQRIQSQQKDGSMSRMTDEEHEKGMAEARKAITENCS